MFELLYPVATFLLGYAVVLFLLSLFTKRNDMADVAWGPGIALTALVGAYVAPIELGWPHYLMLGLIVLWASRLGVRIYRKNRGKPEDARYRQWRESWGQWFYLRSFFQVFLLQCFLMLLLAASALVAVQTAAAAFFAPVVVAGLVLWLIGFVFEVVGDYQLDRFLQNPDNKGKLMRYGLWRYTRHPNYFGEITMWWGLWLMTLTLPYTWLALISPVTITILIRFVSGVPMLEKQMAKHPEWADYAARTNMLVPAPPAK